MVPLGQVARVEVARARPGIRTENALLSAYIFVDIRDRDIGSYVADARKAVNEQVKFPPGYYATWSGPESMERAVQKMKVVIPVTLLIIFLLLSLNFGASPDRNPDRHAVGAICPRRRGTADVADGLRRRWPSRWASSPWQGWQLRLG